jgi:hypothetical protein
LDGGFDAGFDAGHDAGGQLGWPDGCHDVQRLNEDFQSGWSASEWRAFESGANLYPSGGTLHIDLPQNAAGDARLLSRNYYALTDSEIVVEAVSMPSSVPATYVFLGIEGDNDHRFSIGIDGADLNVDYSPDDGANWFNQYTTGFSPTLDRWWRIRESGGKLFADVSGNGVNWTELVSFTAPADLLGPVRVELSGGAHAGVPGGTEGQFDNLNPNGPTSYCHVSSFSDDFEDGQLGQWWREINFSNSCGFSESGGEATITCANDGSDQFATLSTWAAFDATSDVVTVRVPEPDLSGGWELALTYASDWGTQVQLVASSSGMVLLRTVEWSSTTLGSVPAGGSWPELWRLRVDSGTVTAEVSVDGAIWTQVGSGDVAPVKLEQVPLQFGIYAPASSGNAVGKIAGVNVD